MNYTKMPATNLIETDVFLDSSAVVESIADKLFTTNLHVKSINHRGYNIAAPENTLPAYKLSRQNGFYYVECDVAFTKDDVPVLLHDATINRTARDKAGNKLNSSICINDITYMEALSYDFGIWKQSRFAETTIPKFSEFILLCRNLGMHPYIEIKSSNAYTETHIMSLVSIVNAYGIQKNVTWISFNSDYLTYIKNFDQNARLGYVVNDITQDVIVKAQSLQNSSNEVFISSNFSSLNDSRIKLCTCNHIPLEVWTVNKVSELLALNPYISGITSDSLLGGSILYHSLIS